MEWFEMPFAIVDALLELADGHGNRSGRIGECAPGGKTARHQGEHQQPARRRLRGT